MTSFQEYVIIYLVSFSIAAVLPVSYLFSKVNYKLRHVEHSALVRVLTYIMFAFLTPIIVLLTPAVLFDSVRDELVGFHWLIKIVLVIVNIPVWLLLYIILDNIFDIEK